MRLDYFRAALIVLGLPFIWTCSSGHELRREHNTRHDIAVRRNDGPRQDYGIRQDHGVRDNQPPYDSFEAHRSGFSGTSQSGGFETKRGEGSKKVKYGFFEFLKYWADIPPDNTAEDEENTCQYICLTYHRNLKEIREYEGQVKYLYSQISDENREYLQEQISELQSERDELNDDDKSLSLKADKCGCLK